jgi:hypothetical protein
MARADQTDERNAGQRSDPSALLCTTSSRTGDVTLWLIIVIESAWMLGCAIVGSYGHVRATTGRVRSTLENEMPQALTKFERKCRAQAQRRRSQGIEL